MHFIRGDQNLNITFSTSSTKRVLVTCEITEYDGIVSYRFFNAWIKIAKFCFYALLSC